MNERVESKTTTVTKMSNYLNHSSICTQMQALHMMLAI